MERKAPGSQCGPHGTIPNAGSRSLVDQLWLDERQDESDVGRVGLEAHMKPGDQRAQRDRKQPEAGNDLEEAAVRLETPKANAGRQRYAGSALSLTHWTSSSTWAKARPTTVSAAP